jgi:uncharacterized membrane protein YeiB
VAFILVYNLLQIFIPITTAWNLKTTAYIDFWTPIGFLRNTFYNGWNSIFPWFAYFLIGMYLGNFNWQNRSVQKMIFLIGFIVLALFKGLRMFVKADFENPERNAFYKKYWMQIMEDYFPANLPFIFITVGYALMVISTCMYLGSKYSKNKLIELLAKTGQMTLTHYVLHLTIGVVLLAKLTSKNYTGYLPTEQVIEPIYLLSYSLIFYIFSIAFSFFWSKRFKKGPMEIVMRKISNS